MKKGLIFALVMLFVFSLAGMSYATTYLSIATGGTGGTYYPIGGALANLITKHTKGLTVTAETGNASVANCNLIGAHKIEFALVQNNVASWAYNGKYMFKGKAIKNLRAITSLYPETIQIVALKKSGIKSVNDLKGKKVSIGAPGSGTSVDAVSIIEAHGLSLKDMKVDYLSFNETVKRMKDGQLDAGFVTAGYPTAAIMDLATTRNIVIVPISEDMIKKIHAKYPYYVKTVIPANTYKGVKEDVSTVTCMAMMVADEKVPEETVYKAVKAMWDNIEEIRDVHAKAKLIQLKTALYGVGIPLHPGAEKYYKEKGLIK